MIELTQAQRQELAGPEPVRARDPETNETYVLVRAAVYERLKGLLHEDAASPPPATRAVLTAADLLGSGLVGMWADRTDLGDSREFARRLREQAQTRGRGA